MRKREFEQRVAAKTPVRQFVSSGRPYGPMTWVDKVRQQRKKSVVNSGLESQMTVSEQLRINVTTQIYRGSVNRAVVLKNSPEIMQMCYCIGLRAWF
jgi:hypothetical protein